VAIDVVDEQQHVAALAALGLLVAEVLRHGQAGERHTQTVARRLVHLAVHHGHLGLLEVVELNDARLGHLVVEVVAFAGALAHAGEYRQAGVRLGDVVDELEHVDGLAHAGAAEQADLAALGERHQQVDDLDAGLEQVLPAGLLVIGRGGAVDGPVLGGLDGAALVLRRAEHVHDASERALADRHGDRRTGGLHGHAALQALRDAHGNRAHHAVAELLLHLEREIAVLELERLVDARNLLARDRDVEHGDDDLHNLAGCHYSLPLKPNSASPRARREPRHGVVPRRRRWRAASRKPHLRFLAARGRDRLPDPAIETLSRPRARHHAARATPHSTAAAPPTISLISLVIAA